MKNHKTENLKIVDSKLEKTEISIKILKNQKFEKSSYQKFENKNQKIKNLRDHNTKPKI